MIDHLEREILTPLQDLARFERPKKIALLPHPLTVEGGELTPTLKVKRKEVDRKFGELIDPLYIAG